MKLLLVFSVGGGGEEKFTFSWALPSPQPQVPLPFPQSQNSERHPCTAVRWPLMYFFNVLSCMGVGFIIAV